MASVIDRDGLHSGFFQVDRKALMDGGIVIADENGRIFHCTHSLSLQLFAYSNTFSGKKTVIIERMLCNETAGGCKKILIDKFTPQFFGSNMF